MTRDAEFRLAALAAANAGRLTPEAVVEDARSKTSPLHQYFEWDDKRAAHTARLEAARRLIKAVDLTVVDRSFLLRSVVYSRDPRLEASEQGYISLVEARDDAELSRLLLQQELRRIIAMIERARRIADALGITDEFASAMTAITRLRDRLAA